MLSFKDFCQINESPEGAIGDWDGEVLSLVGKSIAQSVLDKRYQLLLTENSNSYYLKSSGEMCLVVDNTSNLVIGQLKMSRFDISVASSEGRQTNMVKVDPKYRTYGIAKTLYKLLIDNDYTLICDYEQYDGARSLWKSLGHIEGIHKYLYDETKDTLTEYKDFEDESKIWSFDNASKRYILMVVSKSSLNTKPKY